MFRAVSIIGFVATFLGIAICCIVFPCCKECRWSPAGIFRRAIRLFTLLLLQQKLTPIGVLRKLVFLLAVICVLVLGITSFYPVLILNKNIYGYWLILHATFAAVFAICIAVLAVISASQYSLNWNDWPWLMRFTERITLVKCSNEQSSLVPRPSSIAGSIGQKILFWTIIILSLPLMLSIILSMFTLFGTYWQNLLIAIHRWTALAFALVAIIYAYLIIRMKMKQ